MPKTPNVPGGPTRAEPSQAPLARKEEHRAFPGLLEKSKAEIAKLIAEPAMVERFVRVALTEFRKNPDLASCTPESVMASVMEAARLNLEIGGSLRQAALIPFGTTCTFQVSYIGMLELARRSGEFRDIESCIVYDNDVFSFERDPLPKLYHRPNLWAPGKGLGAYVFAILANGAEKFDAMNVDQIQSARKQSRAPNSLMWTVFWDQAWKKTALKRFLKTQKLSPELARAIELDNEEYDVGNPGRSHAHARIAPRRGVAGLAERLGIEGETSPPRPSRVGREEDDPAPGRGDEADPDPGVAEMTEGAVPGEMPGDEATWQAGRE